MINEYQKVWDGDRGDYIVSEKEKHDDAIVAELEKLKKELEHFKSSGIIEIAVRNPNVASYMDHWETRALNAERELEEVKNRVCKWHLENLTFTFITGCTGCSIVHRQGNFCPDCGGRIVVEDNKPIE